mmetsp:Transcript_25561/g.53394  ORF Transcript_25561/g.53394 Transcript_25561/m.53394 type:complete len:207 (-) Transcript_25561:2800-3420(-)
MKTNTKYHLVPQRSSGRSIRFAIPPLVFIPESGVPSSPSQSLVNFFRTSFSIASTKACLSKPYSFTRYSRLAPCAYVPPGTPSRIKGLATACSANISAVADPIPPITLWFSIVMMPCLMKLHTRRISFEGNGTIVDKWRWRMETSEDFRIIFLALMASSVQIPAVIMAMSLSLENKLLVDSNRAAPNFIGECNGNKRGTSPRSIRM